MKQLSILVLSIGLILATLLTGCTPKYVPNYIEEAQKILEEYQIDGVVSIEDYQVEVTDEVVTYCDVIVTSEGFADLSDSQKKEIREKLADPELTRDMSPTIRIVSQGSEYTDYTHPLVMPEDDFVKSWDTYDGTYDFTC